MNVRVDDVDGPSLAVLDLTPQTGEPAIPRQAIYLQGVPPDASGLQQLEATAYDNWREVTVSVTDPAGPHTLWLTFESEASGPLLELDWVRFNGKGVPE
jgi:hypothetical protein